ncbi:MAG TPA: hypothetical protein VN861_03510 [Candidatus Acidoferrales bacterium]|nr:hypothetical protein [Candidatus Acidoferrales bacterium]
MIVTPFEPQPPYPQRILGPQSITGHTRSPGLHLTDVIRDIASTIGIAKDSAGEDDLDWYASGGWLWERVFDLAHAEAVTSGTLINPGEFECDGIVGTPDRLDTKLWELWELKCRWMAAWKFEQLEKYFFLELMQCKSYCHMVSTNVCNLGVFFVAGNWRPPVPQAPCVRLEFSDREIADNWSQIMEHAQKKGWL